MKIYSYIEWSIDHDTGYSKKSFLVGDLKGLRFVRTFRTNSLFNISLIRAKKDIIHKFKILFYDRQL